MIISLATSATIDTDSAFESAFNADWQRVFRFALAWTNDIASAEDLAQDAYARLWQHRTEVDWSRPMLPWLFVTTRRLATDRVRRLALILRSSGTAPALADAASDRWLDIRDAMKRLSRAERAALAMSTEGYSAEEVAAALGISAGAVRAAISRARRKLEETE